MPLRCRDLRFKELLVQDSLSCDVNSVDRIDGTLSKKLTHQLPTSEGVPSILSPPDESKLLITTISARIQVLITCISSHSFHCKQHSSLRGLAFQMSSTPSAFSASFNDMSSSSPLLRLSETSKTPSFYEKLEAELSYRLPRKEKPPRSLRTTLTLLAVALLGTFMVVRFMLPSKSQIDRVPYAHSPMEE